MADAIVLPISDEARWAIQALEIHRVSRAWFGLGRQMCGMCDQRWGSFGCQRRRNAINALHAHLTYEQRQPLVKRGLLAHGEALHGVETAVSHRRLRTRLRSRNRPSPVPRRSAGHRASRLAATPQISAVSFGEAPR